MIKRLTALVLGVAMLAGCASSGVATPDPAPTAAPQNLTVYDAAGESIGAGVLAAYAEKQGVTLTMNDTPDGADLVLLPSAPAADGSYTYPDGRVASFRVLSADPLLAAAATRAGLTPDNGDCTALPLGRTLYGYWADSTVLSALLGEDGITALQNASWEEWSAFAEAVQDWIDNPAEPTETAEPDGSDEDADPDKTTGTELTLNGTTFTLPAEVPEAASGLTGVFAVEPGALSYAGPALTEALLAAQYESAPDADTLTGPLNGLYAAFALESECAAQGETALTALRQGNALFYRGRLCDVAATQDGEFCERLIPVPFKQNLTDEDIVAPADDTPGYNLPGLMNYLTLAAAGYLAIPTETDDAQVQAAQSAILWLYSGSEGETALIETLHLVTPWGTASNVTALGAMQVETVSAGILPEVTPDATAAAELLHLGKRLAENGDWSKAVRDTWVDEVKASLIAG